ncbi:hypothetical protein [Variovorax sp. GT1P44]|uniref:hypothetical protein n=1 Tax=Variovorax sp. GT1P44 TaxID=3443742 RepID=UPI003F4495AA
MNVFTQLELFAGLFSAVGAGILMMVAISRPPRFLHEEIAQRIEESITVIDQCRDLTDRHRR